MSDLPGPEALYEPGRKDGQTKVGGIERSAKCRHLKKIPVKGLCATGVYLSEAQNPIPPPPPHTHTLCRCIQYNLFTQEGGEGGRVEPERRLKGQQFTKLDRKYQHD